MKFENYIIRPLEIDDAESFFDLIEKNRKRLETFFSGTVARTKTLEDTKNYVDEIIGKIRNKTYLPFLIIFLFTDAVISNVTKKLLDFKVISFQDEGEEDSRFRFLLIYVCRELDLDLLMYVCRDFDLDFDLCL